MTTKRVYIIDPSDASAVVVQQYLKQECKAEFIDLLPCQIQLDADKVANREIFYLFTSDTGHYPGKYLRHVDSIDWANAHGFKVPVFVQVFTEQHHGRMIALKSALSLAKHPKLGEALRQLHYRHSDGRWYGPAKPKGQSRLALHQIKKNERMMGGREAILERII